MTRGVAFLLLSGGVGSRSGHFEPKQFRLINGLEMIAYSLRVAAEHAAITEIVVNAPDGFEKRTLDLCDAYAGGKLVRIVPFGQTRQDSVRIMLAEAASDTVILHEAARPMLDRSMIDALLAEPSDNAGLFAPIPFSMCEIDRETGTVLRNVPRDKVLNIQLPQKFKTRALSKAHRLALSEGREFTEDAVMVTEMIGEQVKALPGHVKNLKVTNAEDFSIAAKLLEEEDLN